jgi:hypothetical protein
MLSQGKWPGWPSGDSQFIMDLAMRTEELQSRYGLKFIRERDDLGWFEAAHFIDQVVGPVVIYCYDYSPSGGALVYVDVSVDPTVAVPRLVDVLELERSMVNGAVVAF